MNAIISDGRVLRGMVRHGWIEWWPQLERHWTGGTVKRAWVQPGPKLANWYDEFVYRGVRYRLRYIDGCFHPFVCRMDRELPAFV